ncbi:hypothetical protein U1Q18_016014 [Sarracenia purpurea var. burkii]
MGGGHGGNGHSTTYKGVTLHHPKRWHTLTGKGMCAMMWFWVLYRAKQDGPVVLGWRHPWEGHEDHAQDHGHGNEDIWRTTFPFPFLACERSVFQASH